MPLINEKDNKGRRFKTTETEIEQVNSEFFEGIAEVDVIDVYSLNQDEIIGLIKGDRVQGAKLEKNDRRELKFAIKRDTETHELLEMLDGMLNGKRSELVVAKRREAEKVMRENQVFIMENGDKI